MYPIENLERVADVVTVNIKHIFSDEQLAQESQLLAQTVMDKATEENNKKVAMSTFANKIKQLDAEIKVHSGHVASGFTYRDTTAEMYRDYVRSKRVYIDKSSREMIKEEPFRESDYQKKLDFDGEENNLTTADMRRQQQIEENNQVGTFAEEGMDALGKVIADKQKPGSHKLGAEGKKLSDSVKGSIAAEKPKPKDNLDENYGRDLEQGDDLPEGLGHDRHGNITDIEQLPDNDLFKPEE